MNRNRRTLDKKTRKMMEKQVKHGQEKLTGDKPLRSDHITAQEVLATYPKKRQKSGKPLAEAIVKEMQVKKKKKGAKHSKRTTPGEIDHRESPPAFEHKDGGRWEKALVQQNQKKRTSLTAKLRKTKASIHQPKKP